MAEQTPEQDVYERHAIAWERGHSDGAAGERERVLRGIGLMRTPGVTRAGRAYNEAIRDALDFINSGRTNG